MEEGIKGFNTCRRRWQGTGGRGAPTPTAAYRGLQNNIPYNTKEVRNDEEEARSLVRCYTLHVVGDIITARDDVHVLRAPDVRTFLQALGHEVLEGGGEVAFQHRRRALRDKEDDLRGDEGRVTTKMSHTSEGERIVYDEETARRTTQMPPKRDE
jgi:hypothetical protein